MPTGGGKSLTFQLSALTDPGISVIIMPLRSLIYDQYLNLQAVNIEAALLLGSLTRSE